MIFHNDRLPQIFGKFLRNDSTRVVCTTTWRIGNNESYRFIGIRLRLRPQGYATEQKQNNRLKNLSHSESFEWWIKK
jgi:hypothetical protein